MPPIVAERRSEYNCGEVAQHVHGRNVAQGVQPVHIEQAVSGEDFVGIEIPIDDLWAQASAIHIGAKFTQHFGVDGAGRRLTLVLSGSVSEAGEAMMALRSFASR